MCGTAGAERPGRSFEKQAGERRALDLAGALRKGRERREKGDGRPRALLKPPAKQKAGPHLAAEERGRKNKNSDMELGSLPLQSVRRNLGSLKIVAEKIRVNAFDFIGHFSRNAKVIFQHQFCKHMPVDKHDLCGMLLVRILPRF